MPAAQPQFDSLSVEHASTVERVTAELRRAVFEGDVESGTPLRELALAESLGVSRPTVREALMALVAEGLATREPNRGVSVATPRAESVRDVCAARWVLEGAGIRAWPTAVTPRASGSARRSRPTRARYAAGRRRTRSSTNGTSPSTSPWSSSPAARASCRWPRA